MADKYWSGLGVADGTTVTTGNVMTAGNTDADGVTYSVGYFPTGTPTITYARPADPMGPGVSITGSSSAAISRLEPFAPSARGAVIQVRYTPSGAPTADSDIVVGRSGTDAGFTCFLFHLVSGNLLRVRNSASTGLASSPALTANHTYQIDVLTDLNSGTPSTTNGRIVVRVQDLTDATWNTTGEYFYDSGYTTNIGTVQPGRWRVGKCSTAAVHPQAYFTGLRWGDRTAADTSTDPQITRAQFLAPSPTPPLLSPAARRYHHMIVR